jgi:acyl-CoA dehydrogenase
VLNGAKRYITNAPVADVFTVFAAHPDAGARPKISAFVVEKGSPGLSIGKVIPIAGGRGAFHSEVFFENLSVPLENLLGKEGEGFAIAMQCLDAGRINWATYCVGAAQQLLEAATAHAKGRQQFGKLLARNQGIQWMLADMAADLHAARLACYEAAWRYDLEPQHRASVSAMAKLIASEMVYRVGDSTLQTSAAPAIARTSPSSASGARFARSGSWKAPRKSCATSLRATCCASRGPPTSRFPQYRDERHDHAKRASGSPRRRRRRRLDHPQSSQSL